MKYYFHYAQTHHFGDDVRLSYFTDKSNDALDADALDFDTAIRVLKMYNIWYGTDSYETLLGNARFIWIKDKDIKKISKLLLNIYWDSTV